MSDSLPKQKKLIPISEAAKVLCVSIDTVRRWDKSGVLHSERSDGKNRYFSLNELEKHKFGQPLSISETARELGISAVTLRRLEARGLIKPKRNNAGERVYDKDSLKNFLNSDYYLRKKQIKEKPSEPIQKEKESLKEITIDSQTQHKPRSSVPDFLAISAAVFLLLVTLGIGNIKLSEAKNSKPLPSPAALAKTEEAKPLPSPVVLAATEEAKPTAIVTIKIDDSTAKVNIRQKPTTNSEKIGEAKDGDTFEFVSEDLGWFEVKLTDGSTGFISATYVEKGETNN